MGARIDYKGTIKRMNNGQMAEVIEYISSKDMTIQFEDGNIVEHVKKVHFDKGKVANPGKVSEHIGETRTMSNGLKATIIEYMTYHNITVKFENDKIVKNRKYYSFLHGAISDTERDYSSRKETCLNETVMMKCGMKATCIEYINTNNITVKFEDGGIIKNVVKKAFLEGKVLSPNIDKTYYCLNKDEHIGTRKQMNCNEWCTITEYENCDNITVTFDDGTVVENRTLNQFNLGAINKEREHFNGRTLPQLIIYSILKEKFSNCKMNYRPDWLKNDRTGMNFEIDVFIPDIKTGIEYDGHNNLHMFATENNKIKYDKIIKAKELDRLILIQEKGCIDVIQDTKIKNYKLNHVSQGNEYIELIEEIVDILNKEFNVNANAYEIIEFNNNGGFGYTKTKLKLLEKFNEEDMYAINNFSF